MSKYNLNVLKNIVKSESYKQLKVLVMKEINETEFIIKATLKDTNKSKLIYINNGVVVAGIDL